MPTALKVVVAVNVVSVTAIALLTLIAGGQLLPGAYSSDEGHEIKLVPIQPDEPTVGEEIARPVQRAEIPAEYRNPDPALIVVAFAALIALAAFKRKYWRRP